ncbi:MAG: DNA cytosine methyltransferase [Bacteroidales bacterium]|nr:DNA cytosine methyltransferase [Bacteroidales bacterium]
MNQNGCAYCHDWFTYMNIFSFFSGAGFLDLGFEIEPAYNIVYVNEYHKAFDDIYIYAREKMNIPEPEYGHHVGDITELLQKNELIKLKQLINQSKSNHITGIIGGPPCPDFSVAGKNRGKDGENGKLSGTYARIICNTEPHFFLFENVKGLYRTAKHREFFEQLKTKFNKSGYYLTERLVNAIEYGAPQDRERIILIGIHRAVVKKLSLPTSGMDLLDFPWDKYKVHPIDEIKSCPWPTTSTYKENSSIPAPNGIIKELTVEYWWEKNDVEHHPNANMYFRPRAGIVRFASKDEGDDKKKCFKRLHRWRYSPTAAYGNNEVHIHPYKPRRISVAEALAIQSLPKEFELPPTTSLSDAFKTIGNGVPFLLANCIAKSIADYLKQNI